MMMTIDTIAQAWLCQVELPRKAKANSKNMAALISACMMRYAALVVSTAIISIPEVSADATLMCGAQKKQQHKKKQCQLRTQHWVAI